VLPVNDTCVYGTWWDSYPYSCLSVCALHPMYLRLAALAEPLPPDLKEAVEAARRRLDGHQARARRAGRLAARWPLLRESGGGCLSSCPSRAQPRALGPLKPRLQP